MTGSRTGENVTEGKPHPEVVLQAAAGLGLEPRPAVAIEDARKDYKRS